MKKKLFSLFLAICMMISLLPVTASADSWPTQSGNENNFWVKSMIIGVPYNASTSIGGRIICDNIAGYTDEGDYITGKKKGSYYLPIEATTYSSNITFLPDPGMKLVGYAIVLYSPNTLNIYGNIVPSEIPSEVFTGSPANHSLNISTDGSCTDTIPIPSRSFLDEHPSDNVPHFVAAKFVEANANEIPAKPTNLLWEMGGSGNWELNWDAVDDADHYRCEIVCMNTTLEVEITDTNKLVLPANDPNFSILYASAPCRITVKVSAIKNKVRSEEATSDNLHNNHQEYRKDDTHHWRACIICEQMIIESKTEHTFGEWIIDTPATDTTPGAKHRTCSVPACGYTENAVIAPITPPVTPPSTPSREPDPEPTYLPYIADDEMTWDEVCKYLKTLNNGDEVDIHLGGADVVPEKVMTVIADKELRVNFIYSYAKSWFVDGAKIDSPAETNLAISAKTSPDTSELRGIVGTSFEVFGTNFPVEQTISFKTEHAGKFANLYKIEDDKPVFVATVRIDEDGKAKFADMSAEGEYVIMIGEYSDLSGDMDNNGIVNVNDALAVLKRSLGILNGKNPYVADVNNDGAISITDALLILKASIAG